MTNIERRKVMKLATFTDDKGTRIGVIEGSEVVDVTAAAPELAKDMTAFLALGPDGISKAKAAIAGAPRLTLASVKLEAPVPNPGKFLAVGLNYADHIRELNAPTPEFPSCFAKVRTCINGPYDPVHRPRVSDTLDYEGELGFVIGRRCRHVPKDRAHEVIAGYVVVNDFTVREWVAKTPQVVIPKSFDTHGPFGPWLVTSEDVGDPHVLAIKTWVNDELRQDSNTGQMTFDCYDLVEILSRAVTLEPGDVVTTGTPYGVGEGFDPKRYLKPGDVVKVEIEKLGFVENAVIEEPESTVVI
jgi:2-keto-4-pentenoate hydratase/2-oxohepta-3-ene-1,7-dioic acid hydratase in catechol pathway